MSYTYLFSISQKLEEERSQELSEKEDGILEELAAKAQLNEKEAQRIVKKHAANVKAYDGRRPNPIAYNFIFWFSAHSL